MKKYTLELNEDEVNAFLDIFVAGVEGNEDELCRHTQDVIRKISNLGLEFEADQAQCTCEAEVQANA
jgi:hypothetical protein